MIIIGFQNVGLLRALSFDDLNITYLYHGITTVANHLQSLVLK